MPCPRAFARFNRAVANPLTRLFAGWLPPFAIVSHRGRVSGGAYSTPVLAFGTQDGLVFALPYGASSDWVKNVLVAGQLEVRRLGKGSEYVQPRLVEATEGQRLVPAILRVPFWLLRVRHFLRVTASPSGPAARLG